MQMKFIYRCLDALKSHLKFIIFGQTTAISTLVPLRPVGSKYHIKKAEQFSNGEMLGKIFSNVNRSFISYRYTI